MSSIELRWYESVRSRVVDLVGDYAGKELFLVEGDSLLLECFGDERLDFHDGFQLLHAVYVVETFLENLIKRGCNFHIVFFEVHAELCVPSLCPQIIRPRYLLARSALIHHLVSHLSRSHPKVQILRFTKYNSPPFRQYLESTGIYFVMSHDGSKHKGSLNEASINQTRSIRMLREMIFSLTLMGFNVALINEVEWRDSKVMTSVIEGDRRQNRSETSREAESSDLCSNSTQDILSNLAVESIERLLSVIDRYRDQFREREYLTIFCMSQMLKNGTVSSAWASFMLLHLACLRNISIAQRRMKGVKFNSPDEQNTYTQFFADFSKSATGVMNDVQWRKTMQEHAVECDVEDLVDGRLLKAVLHAVHHGRVPSLNHGLISEDFNMLLSAVKSFNTVDLSPNNQADQGTEMDKSEQSPTSSRSILAFSNSVFDKHLGSIHISVDVSHSEGYEQYLPIISRELSHWHNSKRPIDQKKAATSSVKPTSRRWNPLRSNQIYMAEMTAYAASLTNTKGKTLTPEIISSTTTKAAGGSSSGGKEQKKKEPKIAASKAADRIKSENKVKMEKTDRTKALAAWDEVRKRLDKLDPEPRYIETCQYFKRLDETRAEILRVEVEMYCMQALLICWAGFCKSGNKEEGYNFAALIWDIMRRLGSPEIDMSKAAAAKIDTISLLLGLSKPAASPIPSDRPLSFTFLIPQITGVYTLSIDILPREFQLLHCGPYMDRNTNAKPDDRVPAFQPDGWQRQVLDELDANHSVFVVAPTSAGKTFISFYAMEKVLRGSNDGVLVYVAPTKALVNQIAAEIHGRFSKTYPHAGHSVWAIHTRDYRINNPSGCQILVTVPHILQIMLLAPSNARSWAPRVKRIIFDEIHSIGQAEDGVVWEQLLLLAPCQIIALSATVGNPEEFNEWLTSTQNSSGIKLTIIQHKQRYSDLRKFVFVPPKHLSFKGLKDAKQTTGILGLDGMPNLSYFHPVASLVNKSRGMPDDLTLEPRDCLYLWKAMKRHQTESHVVPEPLDPKIALPAFMKRVDVFAWEHKLKEVLIKWMGSPDSPFDHVMEDLGKNLYSRLSNEDRSPSSDDGDVVDSSDLCSTTFPLLLSLHERNALPAIFFNYDRFQCERIACAVLEKLEKAEKQYKESNVEWKRLTEGFDKWKRVEEAKKARKDIKGVSKKKKKGKAGSEDEADDDPMSKADAVRDGASQDKQFYETFDPNEPMGKYSFADNKKYESALLQWDLRTLERKGLPSWLGECLKRGIGVHHAGMNRKYRQIVEMLFRKGYLRVVVATGTLSLGINMPCSTVVFSGDSVFLTALNFRQAAGRAGRRGFDLLGNIVFQGIKLDKVCRLLSSRLPDLNGHFPITTSLVLRLFILLNESETSEYAVQAINALLSQPRLYMGGENFKHQVLHHLRFSIEYLRKQYLLSSDGQPINFANCVSHLYYTENSSFAFHALLRDGYFQELCSDMKSQRDALLRAMMVVMAHLFGRRYCRTAQEENLATVIKKSPSIVFLPPMPEKANAILRAHNKDTLNTYSTYVETFATQHIHDEERSLPLTKVQVGGKGDQEAATALGASTPTISRSAFVALSGHGDNFKSISDLCTTVRAGVFLEQAVVPHLEVYPDERKAPLNAYLYDFFMHGSLEPLETANRIRKSEVWFMLNDFSLVLATIVTSLSNFLQLKAAQDVDMTSIVGSGDALEIDADERLAEEMTAPAVSQVGQKLSVPSTKKKVAASWDDIEDDTDDVTLASNTDGSRRSSTTLGGHDDKAELVQVYEAFVQLRTEFDEKFKAIGA